MSEIKVTSTQNCTELRFLALLPPRNSELGIPRVTRYPSSRNTVKQSRDHDLSAQNAFHFHEHGEIARESSCLH